MVKKGLVVGSEASCKMGERVDEQQQEKQQQRREITLARNGSDGENGQRKKRPETTPKHKSGDG